MTATKQHDKTELSRQSAIQTLKKLFSGNQTFRETPKAPTQYMRKQKSSLVVPIEAQVPDVAMFQENSILASSEITKCLLSGLKQLPDFGKGPSPQDRTPR